MVRSEYKPSRSFVRKDIRTDMVIVGGGLAGTCCAITAARAGLNVVLVQDRPVLGGNSSSEVRLWVLGATSHMGNNNRWAREGGVIDEILVENMYRNPEGNAVIFDTVLLDKVTSEPGITLLLNTAVFEAHKSDDETISSVTAFCSQNSTMYGLSAPLFCDASGDGVVGFLAGAAFRMGAESKEEFDERFAPSKEYGELLGHSLYFYSKDTGRPVNFVAPDYAISDIQKIPRFRKFNTKDYGCNLWWLEYGGRLDTIHETETIKWELWKVVYGAWNYIKNSGNFPEAKNLTLEWVGAIPGKRESRRFEGDYILNQRDIVEMHTFDDAVSYGGWSIDLHPADGVFSEKPGCNQWHSKGIYQIPYRCYYSKNIRNLFLAGRIISATHVAFGSSRVMATGAYGGQAVGMAAAVCKKNNVQPREVLERGLIRSLQQNLLRTGHYIPGVSMEDQKDLTQEASLSASSELQLAELPETGILKTLDPAVAQMIPLRKGKVPSFIAHAHTDKPATLEVELRTSTKASHHTPDVVIESRSLSLQPGKNCLRFSFEKEMPSSQYAFLVFKKNLDVKLHFSTKRITGILSVYNLINEAVSNYGKQTPPEDIGVEEFEFWCPQRRPEGHNVALKLDTPLNCFSIDNIRNGTARPTDAPNAWVADSNDPHPSFQLKWNTPKSIRTIVLKFDTDFDHPMETVLRGHSESVMPFCVRNYSITDGSGKIVYEKKNNYQTINTITFASPVTTDKLTIHAEHPSADIPAAVFEVLCYEETAGQSSAKDQSGAKATVVKNGWSAGLSLLTLLIFLVSLASCSKSTQELTGEQTQVTWKKTGNGWEVSGVQLKKQDQWVSVGAPSGEYTLLYSEQKPDSTPTIFKTNTGVQFPEPIYRYQQGFWKVSTEPVALNTAGQAFHFFPSSVTSSNGDLVFGYDNDVASVTATWKIDKEFPADVMVEQVLVARKDGYYSLATPTLATIEERDMAWATVPGYFQGDAIQEDFIQAYAYGQGVPELPVIYPERCASTLTSIIDTKEGASLAVAPAPGLGRDPWASDHNTHGDWNIGLSHKNRKSALSPTLYFPVLGQKNSKLKTGDTIRYTFRYSLINGNWFQNLRHAAYDVYHFGEGLAMRTNKQSLTDRVQKMHHYLTDSKTSMWNIENYDGVKIGAQSYLGGVVGSEKDAMKNADYGAMWMLASVTGDPYLKKQVLPYALNFKLKQQDIKPGFFQGAAIGQYYLAKRKMFVEEWGEFIEPISLTYYTMLDVGNMLLFEPENKMLQERLRLGAELLLKWQKADGSWEVAYERKTHEPLFKDIEDLRPTFYGLLVAYRILKDEKYLQAAKKGADWLVKNSVARGRFIGVCGDARYAPDFATGQTAQALLDLYDITKDNVYKEAAIDAAKIYTASIYTHPVPSHQQRTVYGEPHEEWEIAQSGLSFEHGGIMGSAQRQGPIQLASHAGMFVRFFKLTGDSIFVDMARAGAIGRDAFVDQKTSVASYYWIAMGKGAGPYPHHAWWQIGWISDYLMAEAELRSEGNIVFPRGFVTPKVGPHQTLGFEPGKIYGEAATLVIRDGLVSIPEPNIEFITSLSANGNRLFIIVLNDKDVPLTSTLALDLNALAPGKKVSGITELTGKQPVEAGDTLVVSLPPYGIKVFAVDL